MRAAPAHKLARLVLARKDRMLARKIAGGRRWALVLLYETDNPVAPERRPINDPGP